MRKWGCGTDTVAGGEGEGGGECGLAGADGEKALGTKFIFRFFGGTWDLALVLFCRVGVKCSRGPPAVTKLFQLHTE